MSGQGGPEHTEPLAYAGLRVNLNSARLPTVARVRRQTLCGKSSSLHCVVGLAKCARYCTRGSNHTHKAEWFILKRGMFHTGLTVLAFYDFCERENSLEKKLRCGKGETTERTDLRQCVRAGSVTMHHVPLTLTFLAFPHLSFFSREFSLSQNS